MFEGDLFFEWSEVSLKMVHEGNLEYFEDEGHAREWSDFYEVFWREDGEIVLKMLLLRVRVVDSDVVLPFLKGNFKIVAVFVLVETAADEPVLPVAYDVGLAASSFLDEHEWVIALDVFVVGPQHELVLALKHETVHGQMVGVCFAAVVVFVVCLAVVEDHQLSAYALHVSQGHVVFLVLVLQNDLIAFDESRWFDEPVAPQFGHLADPPLAL
jgi:hypothetical protein